MVEVECTLLKDCWKKRNWLWDSLVKRWGDQMLSSIVKWCEVFDHVIVFKRWKWHFVSFRSSQLQISLASSKGEQSCHQPGWISWCEITLRALPCFSLSKLTCCWRWTTYLISYMAFLVIKPADLELNWSLFVRYRLASSSHISSSHWLATLMAWYTVPSLPQSHSR